MSAASISPPNSQSRGLSRLLRVKAHTKGACHALHFVNQGRGSSDCSILSIDVETGSKIDRLDHAHGDTINKIVNLTESTIASGDNEGCIKNGRKVICGTMSGTLLFYSWGYFKDCSDRFVGLSPNPVNTMLKLDEDRIITGSESGIISLVGILPNRIIQPIAEHDSIHSVERLAFSHDKKFIGSISQDETLKIWDLDELLQGSENSMSNNYVASDSDRDGMEVDENVPIPSKGTKTKNGSRRSNLSNARNFFADM